MTSLIPRTIHIGGAAGYWGESDMAWGQLLDHTTSEGGPLDYLVFDYLAEITMSLLARMRERDPSAGFATDFVTQIEGHLPRIAQTGVRVISNAGGVNPEGCAQAVRALVAKAGLDLRVSVVTGDDLMDRLGLLDGKSDMFSGEPLPELDRIVSANAYLGAFPIAAALDGGADIVITGRVVDSAVTLGALIHAFSWRADDLDLLAQGSLAGHLIECGPQATGGNYTDWKNVADRLVDIGYPVAEVSADGSVVITKPDGTGGRVTRGTVLEQMLYEIGDPAEYILPDVICDFTQVSADEVGVDRVRVIGAKGRGIPDSLKCSVTVSDGYRISPLFFMVGTDAEAKAQIMFDAALSRSSAKLEAIGLPDFSHAQTEWIGAPDDQITFRLSVRHADKRGCAIFSKEALGFALAAPPGLSLYTGARARPQAVTRLFSLLLPKSEVTAMMDGAAFGFAPSIPAEPVAHTPPPVPEGHADTTARLDQLALLRSGDKGDMSNIGIIARSPALLPWIWAAVSEEAVRDIFADVGPISRWSLPGSDSINILIARALDGGGMASMRFDPQGKGHAQRLAGLMIPVPRVLIPSPT